MAGNGHSNAGTFDLNGGELRITQGTLSNQAGGRLVLNDARLLALDGLNNRGQLNVTFGESQVFGRVLNQAGGQIILSGRSDTTFHDAVEVQAGAELRVSAGSTAVFFGAVQQRSGALFTGSGSKFYEGGLSVGDSPGLGTDGGDVAFGAGNVYLAEIGDATVGFDRYQVAGHLAFGGTLRLSSWDGYTGQAGDSFDLFDWGSSSGSFSLIDASTLQLAPGLVLDTSSLYLDGRIAVAAVPEPGTWAMWLAGLAGMGAVVRRRQRQ